MSRKIAYHAACAVAGQAGGLSRALGLLLVVAVAVAALLARPALGSKAAVRVPAER